MKQEEIKRIEHLLDRFFEGETSNSEERELYDLFARKDLPVYLEAYRPVVGYFESGIAREVMAEEGVTAPSRKVSLFRRWIGIGAAVAASLLCLFVWNGSGDDPEEPFNPYAGSYIIRNGVKTELPESMARELDLLIRQAEKNRLEKERMAFEPLEEHQRNIAEIEAEIERSRQMDIEMDRIENEMYNWK